MLIENILYFYSVSVSLQLYLLSLQTALTSIQGELQQMRDSSMHQKRRMNEMLFSLLTDLGEVGTVVGGTASDLSLKVRSVALYQEL